MNACLRAPSFEKNHIVCGSNFDIEYDGKRDLIARDVCRVKAAGIDFRNYLGSFMSFLDFKLCLANLDSWMSPTSKEDSAGRCDYVLLLADDALVTI